MNVIRVLSRDGIGTGKVEPMNVSHIWLLVQIAHLMRQAARLDVLARHVARSEVELERMAENVRKTNV